MPETELDVRLGFAFRKLEAIGIVGGVGAMEILGYEKLLGVLKVHALEGVQFRDSLAGIKDFLTGLLS